MTPDPFAPALDAIPEGYSEGSYQNRRYRLAKTLFSDGRSIKLVAHALAGGDYISLNVYRLKSGADLLKPCEMPEEKVRAFVLGLHLDR